MQNKSHLTTISTIKARFLDEGKHALIRPFCYGICLFLFINLVLTLLITFTPVGSLMDNLTGNIISKKVALLKHCSSSKPIDVLALGTSVTLHAFMPAIFEKEMPHSVNSFNMGIPGSRPDVLKTYLDFHIHRFGKPKLLLLEATDTILSTDNYYMPAIQYLFLMNQDPQYFPLLYKPSPLTFTDRREIILAFLSGIYHYRSIFSPINFENKLLKFSFSPQITQYESSGNTTKISQEKGWSPITIPAWMATPQGMAHEALMTKHRHLDKISKVNLTSLAYLLAYCREQKIPTIVVEWPRLPQYIQIFKTMPLYQEYDQALSHLLNAYHIPFIRLQDANIGSRPVFYENTYHLGVDGAMRYTQVLARQLRNLHEHPEVALFKENSAL